MSGKGRARHKKIGLAPGDPAARAAHLWYGSPRRIVTAR